MAISKRHYYVIFIAGLFLALIAGVFFWRGGEKEEKKSEGITLAEAKQELDYSYRLLEFPFPELRPETEKVKIERSAGAWAAFISLFGRVRPPEFSQTRDWEKKIAQLAAYTGKVGELMAENRLEDARAEIKEAYEIYFLIKKENGLPDRLADTRPFYVYSWRISQAKSKEETASSLAELKLIYTSIKELPVDQRYRELMAGLELAILDTERLLPGPDYEQARKDLLAGAEELYWSY